jgi:hypothetical protein
MKIFYKWKDVYNRKTPMYVCVDDNFKFEENTSIHNFCDFNIDLIQNIKEGCNRDFIDNNHPNLLIYLAFTNEKELNRTYFFKRNTLYKFDSRWYDELGNIIDTYYDIWYEPFLFVQETDYDQAVRYLKLKRLETV